MNMTILKIAICGLVLGIWMVYGKKTAEKVVGVIITVISFAFTVGVLVAGAMGIAPW